MSSIGSEEIPADFKKLLKKQTIYQENMMKTVILIAIGTLLSGLVQAEPFSAHTNLFSAQRPYAKVPTAKHTQADDQWQGASMVRDQLPPSEVNSKAVEIRKQMRLHFISKRPYGDLHQGQ